MKKSSLLIPSLTLLLICSSCSLNNNSSNTSTSISTSTTSSSSTSSTKVSTSTSKSEDSSSTSSQDSSSEDSTSEDNEDDTIDFELPSLTSSSSYDSTSAISIDLTNKTITNNNGFVAFNDDTLFILESGTYSLEGEFNGRIVVSGEDKEVELELNGVTITNSNYSPIVGYNLEDFSISAKKGTTNSIIDNRTSEGSFNSAIYSDCNLTIKGKGNLSVYGNLNNGIHCKDDLKIKNLNLDVKAVNHAIKGNDSITITSASITAISTSGDALKTKNSDVSSKGNQKGYINIDGGTLNLYAAYDGIDAAYDVNITSNPTINIYTDSYSSYSDQVATTSSTFYLRLDNNITSASITAYTESSSSILTGKSVSGGFNRNYLSFSLPSDTTSFKVSGTSRNGSFETDVLNVNSKYNCLALSYRNGNITTNFETYSVESRPGQGGGPSEGNSNKSDYSSKGIKADNNISIDSGTITILSHDDGIHTNSDVQLENGNYGEGNISISGGELTITSDDDGIHTDNQLNITSGTIKILESYEGLEGNIINIEGGIIEINSSDDGINATQISQTPYINFKGGVTYINADGDGIDSNGNILMSGGYVIALGPSNGGNGVLDFDGSFIMNGGYLLAAGCSGMDQKPTLQTGVSGSTSKTSVSNKYLTLVSNSTTILELYVSKSNINYVVYAGEGSSISYQTSTSSAFSSQNYGYLAQ